MNDEANKVASSHRSLTAQAAQTLFRNVFEVHIRPELLERLKARSVPVGLVVRKFQVLFSPEGSQTVEINEEADIQVAFADANLISSRLEKGTELESKDLEEFGEVLRVEPIDKKYANSGFISAAYVRDGEWAVGFDFRLNVERADRVSATASDFLYMARVAQQGNRFAPLVDNLYAACELGLKALLWTHPRGFRFTDKMRKGEIQEEFYGATRDGIFPKPWATAFRELWDLRNPSRYAYEDAGTNWKAVPRWLDQATEIVGAAAAAGTSRRLTPIIDDSPIKLK
jgi:hypothetical protein